MIPFPNKKYQIILADPPWQFKTYSNKGKGRSAEKHYECMTLNDIKALPIASIADSQCILFMWVTFPMWGKAMGLLEAWGFDYKTIGFVWVKQNKGGKGIFTGQGYYTRSNAEVCIIATKKKSKLLSRVAKNVHQVLLAPRGKHSA